MPLVPPSLCPRRTARIARERRKSHARRGVAAFHALFPAHDSIGSRRVTLTLPLRGFPLSEGRGGTPSPSGGSWSRQRPDEGFWRDSIRIRYAPTLGRPASLAHNVAETCRTAPFEALANQDFAPNALIWLDRSPKWRLRNRLEGALSGAKWRGLVPESPQIDTEGITPGAVSPPKSTLRTSEAAGRARLRGVT